MGLFSQVAKGLSSQLVGRTVRSGGKNLIKGITRGSGKLIKGLKGSTAPIIKAIKSGSRQLRVIPSSLRKNIPVVQRQRDALRYFGDDLTRGEQLKLLGKKVRTDMKIASKLGNILDARPGAQLRQGAERGVKNLRTNFANRGKLAKLAGLAKKGKSKVKGAFETGKETATELAKDQLVGRAVLGAGGLLATGGTTIGATVAGNKLSKL